MRPVAGVQSVKSEAAMTLDRSAAVVVEGDTSEQIAAVNTTHERPVRRR